jgi:hypothetical protein
VSIKENTRMTATNAIGLGPALQTAGRTGVTLTALGLSLLLATPAQAAAPTPGQVQPPGTEGLTTMLGWGGWLVSFVCVAGILIVAAMMALKHRRGEGGGEAMGALGWVLGACVLGSAAGPIANALV